MAAKRNRLLDAAIVVAAIAVGVWGSQRVWNTYGEQKSRTRTSQTELRALEVKNEDLMRQRARAESKWGKEEIQRSNGWRGPNEIALEDVK